MTLLRIVVVVAIAFISRAGVAADKNVLMIVADDLGLDLGCYGNQVIKTPNIDRLASEGRLFTHAFCTTASCSASRSVILTGLLNHANGQYGHAHAPHNFHTHDWVQSMPVLLAGVGYRTMLIGKLHVQPPSVYRFGTSPTEGLADNRSPQGFADHAKQFINADPSKPFFIYACSGDPHRDFGNDRSYPGTTPIKYDPLSVLVPPHLPDTQECRAEIAEYYQAVSRFDDLVGRLLEVLRATGHDQDTLVMVLSDNGAPFPGAKCELYDAGTHLPLIVRLRGVLHAGERTSAMVTWADLLPTVLEFTHAAAPKYPLHGRSFLGVLRGNETTSWNEVFLSHTFHEVQMYYPMRSVRTDRYKYILNVAHELTVPMASDLYGSKTWQSAVQRGDTQFGGRSVEQLLHRPKHELYDLSKDPNETINLAEKSEYAAQLTELQKKLKAWQERTKDPWLSKYRYE